MYLTIAGAGVNDYCLVNLGNNFEWDNYDCLVISEKYDSKENRRILPKNMETYFVAYNRTFEVIKTNLEENKRVLYVVSGNPTFYSSMEQLIEYLKRSIEEFSSDNVTVISSVSSKDYLLAKLKISENEVTSMSLHGRKEKQLDLTKFLLSKYTFILCDEFSLETIYLSTKFVQDKIEVILASKLGSKNENIDKINLESSINRFGYNEIKEKIMPYSLLVKRNFDISNQVSNNEEFKTRSGMLTKRNKRLLTLEALQLFSNCTLWDIGSGSGSISIDAYKIFRAKCILIEKNPVQCEMIKDNLEYHCVLGCSLVENDFLKSLSDLTTADRIFIGGGGKTILSKLSILGERLNDNGIIVANIVGLENLSIVIQEVIKTSLDFEIRSVSINDYKKNTKHPELSIAQPDRPLFQVIVRK